MSVRVMREVIYVQGQLQKTLMNNSKPKKKPLTFEKGIRTKTPDKNAPDIKPQQNPRTKTPKPKSPGQKTP